MPTRPPIIFVTFESELAPLGGLAAVMRILPQRMAEDHTGTCAILAPFFREITKCRKALYESIHSTGHHFNLVFGKTSHPVEVFVYTNPKGVNTFLIDSPAFFNAPCDCGDPPNPATPCNPYLDPAHPEQLLQDSLFFCAAVPKALAALGFTTHVTLSLQDWETASVALTIRDNPSIESAACILTVHNPYDKPVTNQEMRQCSNRILRGPTVLTKILPLMDGPIVTVSENFARELVEDPLHASVFAPHLQNIFKKKTILGINNGSFGTLNFPKNAIEESSQGDCRALLEEKGRRRQKMIEILDKYQPLQAWGHLEWTGFKGPVFLFFGRDDPRQKGYDLAAAAIRRIPPGQAKFIFTPIPGDEGLKGLNFLRTLAEERSGEIKVFPFRMAQGYSELQQGASFLMMCSFYEPFGGATEGYVVGTPVIARATGGLVQQVIPYPSPCLTPTVKELATPFHPDLSKPSGFLFHEPPLPKRDLLSGWRTIVNCGYWPQNDRLTQRLNIPLFQAMAKEASQAILDAIEVYHRSSDDYAAMITQGFNMVQVFSWEDTVRKYRELFRTITSRNPKNLSNRHKVVQD